MDALAKLIGIYKELPEFVECDLLNVNQIGNFGNRPLHVAASRGSAAEVQTLLEAGAEIDARGELGNTALHEAVGSASAEVIGTLLAYGADKRCKNDYGETPFDIASMMGRTEIAVVLE